MNVGDRCAVALPGWKSHKVGVVVEVGTSFARVWDPVGPYDQAEFAEWFPQKFVFLAKRKEK